jgi:L-asparaginase
MQKMIEKHGGKVVVLGTGGTIAGTASSPQDNLGYTAAQVGVAELVAAIPALQSLLAGQGVALVCEQVAQLDSKNMDFAVWRMLAMRVQHHLAQADVRGVVITHGTDTLEETAYFLHRVLRRVPHPDRQPNAHDAKPVVLTCAMRPASSADADGPQNLLDAVGVVLSGDLSDLASEVMVVCAGQIHSALHVQKVHTYRLDAFDSGDAPPLGFIRSGGLVLEEKVPETPSRQAQTAIKNIAIELTDLQNSSPSPNSPGSRGALDLSALPVWSELPNLPWPRVEIVFNHVQAGGLLVDALLAQNAVGQVEKLRGIVVAATGNGTLHHALEAALLRAQAAGVQVIRATRCAYGQVMPTAGDLFAHSGGLSPVKARIALMLSLLTALPSRES